MIKEQRAWQAMESERARKWHEDRMMRARTYAVRSLAQSVIVGLAIGGVAGLIAGRVILMLLR